VYRINTLNIKILQKNFASGLEKKALKKIILRQESKLPQEGSIPRLKKYRKR
jgi:hypothetical protein